MACANGKYLKLNIKDGIKAFANFHIFLIVAIYNYKCIKCYSLLDILS